MKVVVAPDSYKECLSARRVAQVMGAALREVDPAVEVVEMPLADGGEGTVEVLTAALGGRICHATVTGPLGEPVNAAYGWVEAGALAILEVAAACGLPLVPPERRNPLHTTTRGVGELILDAFGQGCRHFLIGLGGTSTCDGGAGLFSVPGLRETVSGATFHLLSDVDSPFVGPLGAARIFGPQKGASPEEVEILEQRMEERAQEIFRETGVDVRNLPGAGAAGGLGGSMAALLGARLVSGVEEVLDRVGFDRALEGADLVLTGEGKSDRQTLSGKLPLGVLRRSGSVPVALVSGAIEAPEALQEAGFRYLVPVSPPSLSKEEALRPEVAAHNLMHALSAFFRTFTETIPHA
ncbi:MAG: glycerate kinase [Bacteroidales bacterium]|nr:glycerate kinase [Bacteroidales bacterium]